MGILLSLFFVNLVFGGISQGHSLLVQKTSTKMKQKTLTKLEVNERMFINSLHMRTKFAKVNN